MKWCSGKNRLSRFVPETLLLVLARIWSLRAYHVRASSRYRRCKSSFIRDWAGGNPSPHSRDQFTYPSSEASARARTSKAVARATMLGRSTGFVFSFLKIRNRSYWSRSRVHLEYMQHCHMKEHTRPTSIGHWPGCEPVQAWRCYEYVLCRLATSTQSRPEAAGSIQICPYLALPAENRSIGCCEVGDHRGHRPSSTK